MHETHIKNMYTTSDPWRLSDFSCVFLQSGKEDNQQPRVCESGQVFLKEIRCFNTQFSWCNIEYIYLVGFILGEYHEGIPEMNKAIWLLSPQLSAAAPTHQGHQWNAMLMYNTRKWLEV